MSDATTRKIQIRRREGRNYLPPKVKAKAKRVIGSVFKDRRPLGIADEQLEKKLLKEYEGIRPDDRDFSEKRKRFWKEMRVIVPSDGKVLDISTDGEGEPVKLEDYLIYKWLENHPLVAKDKDSMLNENKDYYLYDPEKEIHNENKTVKARKKAYEALIDLSDSEEVVDQLIRLLADQNPAKMTPEMKENKLDQIAQTQPVRFLKYAEDPNLALRAEVEEMVEYGVLRKSGNQYIYMDEVIGETMQDAIVYFKNDRNSSTVLDLRAKLKEAKQIA